MINITLPEVPVNGYTIAFWKLYVRDGYYSISSMKLVYHVNTKWEEFSKDTSFGEDIVNEWMVFENGICTGRRPNWESVLRFNTKEYNEYFHTSYEAMEEALKSLERVNDYYNERIAQNDELIQDIRKKITYR